tara:strand:+ start:279 stop:524 length:246 start_codon:yes stop_codon:yes gene_type:complete
MNFATYLPVPDDLLDMWREGGKAQWGAVALYRGLPHKLLDGTVVMPSFWSACNTFKLAEQGITIPTVIQNGYTVVSPSKEV